MVIAASLVLLVACGNIAGLMLARTLSRRRELSVRLALGGSRLRIARLLFVESLIVAVIGASLGRRRWLLSPGDESRSRRGAQEPVTPEPEPKSIRHRIDSWHALFAPTALVSHPSGAGR
jgi:hypothetical protein